MKFDTEDPSLIFFHLGPLNTKVLQMTKIDAKFSLSDLFLVLVEDISKESLHNRFSFIALN